MMRILVCGGRNFGNILKPNSPYYASRYAEYIFALETINTIVGLNNKSVTMICGKANGADTIGEDFGRMAGFDIEEYPPDWNMHGKSAGFIRNRQMLAIGKPTLVIAFPGGAGTANMVNISKAANVEVIEILYV